MKKGKKILMIAQIFPPVNKAGSARPFYFAKHLSEFGYFPTVIAAQPEEGSPIDSTLLAELKGLAKVIHIKELNLRAIISFLKNGNIQKNKKSTEKPGVKSGQKDNTSIYEHLKQAMKRYWKSGCWSIPVLVAGLRMRFTSNYDLIWSTGDPWNSLMAGYWLSKFTGKPLVVDLRDPWTYGSLWNPRNEAEANWNRQWERRILTSAKKIIFTSPLTTEIMSKKYENVSKNKFGTITNGFCEGPDVFGVPKQNNKCVFRFVGSVGGHKSPAILFKAISIACENSFFANEVVFQFVGRMNEFAKEICILGLESIVEDVGYVSQLKSVAYMHSADVLVLIQTCVGPGGDCISGKAYEYLNARRPILAIVPEDSGDAWLINFTGSGIVTGINDQKVIAKELTNYWRQWKDNGHVNAPVSKGIEQYSRRNTTRQLSNLFDEVLASDVQMRK